APDTLQERMRRRRVPGRPGSTQAAVERSPRSGRAADRLDDGAGNGGGPFGAPADCSFSGQEALRIVTRRGMVWAGFGVARPGRYRRPRNLPRTDRVLSWPFGSSRRYDLRRITVVLIAGPLALGACQGGEGIG